MKYLILFVSIFFFSGCVKIKYVDASHELRFSKVIGKRYKVLKQLTLHADLADDYKSEKIREFTITSYPGYGNRYVLWRKQIPENTIISIKKALAYDIFLSNDYTFIVEVDGFLFNSHNLPIHLYSLLTKEMNEYIVLDSEFFREIE